MSKQPSEKQQPERGAHVDREKSLDVALAQIEKTFGKGSIMRMGDREHLQIATISTGSLAIDLALGIGGVPRGRVVEIFGAESSGKTTIAMHIMAEAQRAGGIAAFIDAEHAFDPTYGQNLGLNLDELLISQPDTGEQALEIADTLVRSSAIDVVVIDSVAALVPRAEIEGDMGDTHVGLQARLMSSAAQIDREKSEQSHTAPALQRLLLLTSDPARAATRAAITSALDTNAATTCAVLTCRKSSLSARESTE